METLPEGLLVLLKENAAGENLFGFPRKLTDLNLIKRDEGLIPEVNPVPQKSLSLKAPELKSLKDILLHSISHNQIGTGLLDNLQRFA